MTGRRTSRVNNIGQWTLGLGSLGATVLLGALTLFTDSAPRPVVWLLLFVGAAFLVVSAVVGVIWVRGRWCTAVGELSVVEASPDDSTDEAAPASGPVGIQVTNSRGLAILDNDIVGFARGIVAGDATDLDIARNRIVAPPPDQDGDDADL